MYLPSPSEHATTAGPSTEVDAQIQEQTGSIFVFSTGDTQQGESSQRTRTLAPNLTRRSHKKSRAGCLQCKGRKIKCDETKPCCVNCSHKELTCVYPDSVVPRQRRAPTLAARSPVTTSPNTSMTFNMSDMAAFHQFLTIAYPHLPLGNDTIWTTEIPQLGQQYEYLMHAMLALGGSHHSQRYAHSSNTADALIHRGQAIAGLNRALTEGHADSGESTAMLATCYALTFQSVYLPDGLTDFIAFVRGCALITGKIKEEDRHAMFAIEGDLHGKIIQSRIQYMLPVDPFVSQGGMEALERFAPALSTTGVERDFHSSMIGVLSSMQESPQAGYESWRRLYGFWYSIDNVEFSRFIDCSNSVSWVLLAFFVALQLVAIPISHGEWLERDPHERLPILLGVLGWSDQAFSILEQDPLNEHLKWPRFVVSTVRGELQAAMENTTWTGPQILQLKHLERLPVRDAIEVHDDSGGSTEESD